MGVVVFLARRLLRWRPVTYVLVAVVVGALAGVAMFSATAARRASNAFDRFVDWSVASDVVTGGVAGDMPVGERLDRVALLPSVAHAVRQETVLVDGVELSSGELLEGPEMAVGGSSESAAAAGIDRPFVLDGRLPADDDLDSGVIDFLTADRLELDVGDSVTLRVPGGDRLPIRIDAVISHPSFFPTIGGWQFPFLIVGPGFIRAHEELLDPYQTSLQIKLRDAATVEDLRSEMEARGLGDIDLPLELATVRSGARKLTDLEALALWLAALAATTVAVALAYQAVRRQAVALVAVRRALTAIGCRRRDVIAGATVHGVAVGALAATVAVAVAVALSPRAPVGLSRFAEVDRGIHLDWVVLAVGVTALVATIAGCSAIAAALALREVGGAERPLRLAERVGPATATGLRLAFSGPRRAFAGRSLLGGVVAAAAAATAVAGVAASLQHVTGRPELAGGVWDAFVSVDDPGRGDDLADYLSSAPGVAGVAAGGWTGLQVDGRAVYALVLDDRGELHPAVSSGRAPRGEEIALGEAVMRDLGVRPGDRVAVAVDGPDGSEPVDVAVTGEVIVGSTLLQSVEPDQGAVIPSVLFDRLSREPSAAFLLRFEERDDVQLRLDKLIEAAPPDTVSFAFTRSERGDFLALSRLVDVIALLSLVVFAVAIASIGHLLFTTLRRHSPALGVLRAIGMTRRDMRWTAATHAMVISAIAVVGGVLGVAVGRTLWTPLAADLVLLDRPQAPRSALVVASIALVTLSIGIGMATMHRATRRPISSLIRDRSRDE